MAWAVPEYTRSQVDRAGRVLAGRINGDMERSLQVINNWRASHSFPLNTFQMTLRRNARNIEASPVVAQRIKRLSSIEAKLQNESSMQLSQMQDIGGCRAVLASVGEAYELREFYESSSRLRHQFIKENDYILKPKESGYRSIHRVYRYASDRTVTYNGLLIEVQIRSQLQHAWATAVETVGTFLKQALKASRGQEDWLRFFVLMGSAIAIRENKPLVPDTPSSKTELVRELKRCARELDVENKLRAYHSTLKHYPEVAELKNAKYFLLELRPGEGSVRVSPYREKELPRATEHYLEVERTLKDPGSEAVLVSVESLDALTRAYPNYFLDTRIFLDTFRAAIA
jgi:hypothetical protein